MNDKDGECAVDASDNSTSTCLQDITKDADLNAFGESQGETNQNYIYNVENTTKRNPEQGKNGEHQHTQQTSGEGQTPTHQDISVPAANYGIPLLAPILFNRPPFDVEDFRRRLASTNRQPNENVPVEGNIAGPENDRVQAPAAILPRDVAQVGLNDTPLTRALAMGDFDLAESLIMTMNDPEYLNDGKFA